MTPLEAHDMAILVQDAFAQRWSDGTLGVWVAKFVACGATPNTCRIALDRMLDTCTFPQWAHFRKALDEIVESRKLKQQEAIDRELRLEELQAEKRRELALPDPNLQKLLADTIADLERKASQTRSLAVRSQNGNLPDVGYTPRLTEQQAAERKALLKRQAEALMAQERSA